MSDLAPTILYGIKAGTFLVHEPNVSQPNFNRQPIFQYSGTRIVQKKT